MCFAKLLLCFCLVRNNPILFCSGSARISGKISVFCTVIVHEPDELTVNGKGTMATIPFWKAKNIYFPKMYDGHLRCVAGRSYYIINEAKLLKICSSLLFKKWHMS